jgi:hypothetical protein
MTMTPQPREINLRSDSWVCEGNEGDWRVASSENHATHSMAKRGRPLWDMAERAKERKEREKGECRPQRSFSLH